MGTCETRRCLIVGLSAPVTVTVKKEEGDAGRKGGVCIYCEEEHVHSSGWDR